MARLSPGPPLDFGEGVPLRGGGHVALGLGGQGLVLLRKSDNRQPVGRVTGESEKLVEQVAPHTPARSGPRLGGAPQCLGPTLTAPPGPFQVCDRPGGM